MVGRKMYIKWTDKDGKPFVIALEKLVGVKPEDVEIIDNDDICKASVKLANVEYVDGIQEITTILKDAPAFVPRKGWDINSIFRDETCWVTNEELKRLE